MAWLDRRAAVAWRNDHGKMPMLTATTSLGDWGSGVQISPLRPIKSNS